MALMLQVEETDTEYGETTHDTRRDDPPASDARRRPSILSERLNDVDAAGDFWPVTLVPEPMLRKRYHENGLWGDDFAQMLICDADDRILGGC